MVLGFYYYLFYYTYFTLSLIMQLPTLLVRDLKQKVQINWIGVVLEIFERKKFN